MQQTTSYKFHPETAAIILIDHQVGTMTMIHTQAQDVTIRNAALLAKTAKILGMPLVLTSSLEEHFQGPLTPEIQQAAPEEYARRVKRQGIVDAWDDPNFKAAVVATGRKQLIMAGVTTDICLVFPSISAVKEGYDVKAVLDASGSVFQISEDTSRSQMQREGVVLTATLTIMAELVQNWGSPHGPELQQLMMSTLPAPKEHAVAA